MSGPLATSSAAERIRFRGAGDFSRLLNQRAEAVLGNPRAMRRAYRVMWAKSALVIVWTIASYLFLLLVANSPAAAIAGSISLGLAAAAIGFCIMHDANHGGYSTSRLVNRLAAALARPDRRLLVRVVGEAPGPPHLHERGRPRSRHRRAPVRPLRAQPAAPLLAPLSARVHVAPVRVRHAALAGRHRFHVPRPRARSGARRSGGRGGGTWPDWSAARSSSSSGRS